MTVSPNPSSNNVTIKLEEETHAVNIQIFNALGKQILRGSMDNDLSLDIANWPTGKYIVQGVTEQGKRYTTTFIKE